jgi:hypothetical protein
VDKAKKIFITTESFETFVLRINHRGQAFGHCVRCGRDIEVLSIDQAVTASGIRTGELIRRIEANEIHGIETEAGHLLVCAESIAAKVSTKRMEILGGNNNES